ncbi:NADH-quinone oxidoreductase subunit M [Helicobacter cappadocius]|uniref:NADH-quinone oxidoreductase subunit M n=1 Tax=Helicobacter cappadocius TaxID=3063998 RepID=A0AA90PKH7_9HELI|nr:MULTISPECIES: NADH-quinone oxidoreductase subunit M [unclassified Helicobacter]MDO7253716.1 NADH-quinone oxidoreductase subunit M [Helicobacter sp. faydin-H75]MDP2539596.1 NADH-quinone oxidoreductase subunit M [Helicobacter sp. faydin-H76]
MEYLLTIIIFFPALASVFVFIMDNNVAKPYGITIGLIELILTIGLWMGFDYTNPNMQFENIFALIPQYGINYHVGVDGISLFLLVLNSFIMFLATIYVNQKKDKNHLVVCLLLLESILMGVFSSLNMILFYIFWEISLIPILYMIGAWGTGQKIYAALKFFLYTFAASLIMFVGILFFGYLYFISMGKWSFDVMDWYALALPFDIQVWLFLAFFISVAVKIPIFPFHTWLPHAYGDAPTLGSVALAAVLLKMGTYALVRFSLPLFPDASFALMVPVAILALFMIIYGGMLAFAQTDMKQVIAYSSISHMGVTVIGIFAMNLEGLGGAIFGMVGHGIVIGALFMLIGMLYWRTQTRKISDFGGLASVMPNYSIVFGIAMMASVGLPLTVGFVGEFFSLLGFFKTHPIITLFAGTSIIISAIYMLNLYRKIFFGNNINPSNKNLKDLYPREIVVMVCFVVAIIFLGIYPKPLLIPIQNSTEQLLQIMNDRSIKNDTKQHFQKVINMDLKHILTKYSSKTKEA